MKILYVLLLIVACSVRACQTNAQKVQLTFINNSSQAVVVEPLSKDFALSVAPKTKHVNVMYAKQGPKGDHLDLELSGAAIHGAFFYWTRKETKNQHEKIKQILVCKAKDYRRLPANSALIKTVKEKRACGQFVSCSTITFENNTIPTLSENN